MLIPENRVLQYPKPKLCDIGLGTRWWAEAGKASRKQAVTANGSGESASKDLKGSKKKANGVWKRGSSNMAKSLTSLWPSLICKIEEA